MSSVELRRPRARALGRLREKWAAGVYHLYGYRAAHRQADVYVVSFPKSGRTWLRAMLGRYVAQEFGVPFTTELDLVTAPGATRVTFSHRLSDVRRHRGRKVILLLRDPRDTVVSYFHQLHDRQRHYRGTLSKFLRSRQGIDRVVTFMNRLVALERYPSHVLRVTYEGLHADTRAELARVLAFLDLTVDPASLSAAIDFGSFENMQRMERMGEFVTDRLQPTDVANIDSYKVRKGRVGGYHDELDEIDIAYLEQRIAQRLDIGDYRLPREDLIRRKPSLDR